MAPSTIVISLLFRGEKIAGAERNGELFFTGYSWENEKLPEADGRDGCTAMWMCSRPLNRRLENGWNGSRPLSCQIPWTLPCPRHHWSHAPCWNSALLTGLRRHPSDPLPPSPGPTFPWRVPLSPPVSPCRFRPHLLGSLLVFGGGLLPALLPSYYVLFTLQRLPFYVSVPRSLPSLTSDVSSINISLIPPPFLVSSAFPFHSDNDDTFHKATTIFDHCVLFVGVDLSILESPKLAECFACCIVLSLMNNNNDNENIWCLYGA